MQFVPRLRHGGANALVLSHRSAEARGINEHDIIPRMEEWEIFPREAVASNGISRRKGGQGSRGVLVFVEPRSLSA